VNENKFKGIFREYLIVLERIDEEQISFFSSPKMPEEYID